MKILNVMLSKDLGGVQQAFLDHGKALSEAGHKVINITGWIAKVNSSISSTKLPNLGNWDIFSKLYLKLLVFFIQPQIIIAHGGRAIIYTRKLYLKSHKIPVVGVAHGHNVKYLSKCDYVIALTEYMKAHLLNSNFSNVRIALIPNMIHVKNPYQSNRQFHEPIVIGTIARLVKKKGIDVLLRSLAILKQQNVQFSAVIGGDGEEKQTLVKLCDNLQLNQHVRFFGWVTDRDKFFADIDIFCVPSSHEPFGIVVLEALEQSTPIVAAASEGPSEIISDNIDGLLCKINDPQDLAAKIKQLIDNPTDAKRYAKAGYQKLISNYASNVVASKLTLFFQKIINQ